MTEDPKTIVFGHVDENEGLENMGDKKFHSETSLQRIGAENDYVDDEQDPGVLNVSIEINKNEDDIMRKRRTMSQPGPISGSKLTATAARAARRKPMKNVVYLNQDKNEDDRFTRISAPSKGEEYETSAPIGDRSSPLPNNSYYRNADAKSLNSYRLYATNSMNTPRKRSVVTMDAQSIRSVETHAPPPTTPEQNKKTTCKNLSIIWSVTYAIVIVTLGIMILLSDPFLEAVNMSPIYCLILSGVGFLYLLILVIDIGRYKSKALQNQKLKSRHDQNIEEYFRSQEIDNISTPGDRTPVDGPKFGNLPQPALFSLSHDYCFSHGRHGGSFYLKLGATGFAMGHLVHSILLIIVQIGLLTDENVANDDCVLITQVVLDFFYPLYCFFQLFFIYKYSNVMILKWQGLARFAFMHFIGSSICFWIWAIVRETVLALSIYEQSQYGDDDFFSSATNISSLVDNQYCMGNDAVSTIYHNFSPYLYPFSVEFNILIVGIYYVVWDHIGSCENDSDVNDDVLTGSSLYDTSTVCKIPTANEDNNFTSNFVIHTDCHASNRGLFAGMVVLVMVVGMLILGFVFGSAGDDFVETGYLISNSTSLSLHSIMLFATIFAFIQTTKLDINEHPMSLLDDVLLFICIPAFLMETIFTMLATLNYMNIVRFVDFFVMFVQIVIQTALLVDGLRRCSNSRKLRRSKPGRELLIFLLITNVAVWLSYTFSYKSPESMDERYEFYGKVTWSILGHLFLPLIMFYRFHSSVCFADIWDAAYKPGSGH